MEFALCHARVLPLGLFCLVGFLFVFDAALSVCSLDGFLTERRRRSGDICLAPLGDLFEAFLFPFEG